MPPLRLLVTAADPLARAGLASLLDGRAEIAAFGQAAPGELAGALARERWDAVVVDVGSGAGAMGLVREAASTGVPAIALVARDADAGEALRAGASAVLDRAVPAPTLAAAAVAAALGLAVLDREVAAAWLRPPAAAADAEALTPREREVLQLLAEGLSNKAIAARLGISDHTAKFHVNAILAKLGVDSRAEAIVRAARLGLVVL